MCKAASFHEWMVMVDRYSSDCFLLNIISLEKMDLPPREDVPYQFWILSAPPTDDNCIVGFIGEDSHSITFCHPGDGKWVEHTFEPEIGTLRGYTICKGEIYCHGLQHGQANLVRDTGHCGS
ncbi:hypothetical protein RHSIM_Rhsim01G0045700 [Rhododendron simsii]|uniref:KIB1-4 beta-propeller domain-containing protein n=1 Tax=Rhododendron simsii TaxID=118357 RepID=A0A834HJE6_RHOSS|nr:hypothetical protein RHSIM_Rhsim01G0045700 [Rhododendron simsii]